MTRLHATIDKLSPNGNKILLLCTEHVDALATSDLSVQTILLRDLANDNQFVGGNLTCSHSGNDGVGTVTLYVAEILVVRILQAMKRLLHDVLIEHTGQDRPNGGFTDLTAKTVLLLAGLLHDFGKRLQLLDIHNVIEIGSRVGEMGTHMVKHFVAHLLHSLVEYRSDQWHTSTTACTSFRARFYFAERLAFAFFDDTCHVAFRDIVTGAYLGVIFKITSIVLAVFGSPNDELRWRNIQRLFILDHWHKFDIVLSITNHHTTK